MAAGYGGTQSQWLASLVGATGPAGAAGATGATGPTGPAGSTGTTGAQGPQGVAGATGAQGPQGTTGATGSAGAAGQGFNNRGAWAASTTYNPYDVLTYGGQTYEVATAFTSTSTFSATNLNLWAAQGAAGATGATGSTGATGPAGGGTVGLTSPTPTVSVNTTNAGAGSTASIGSGSGPYAGYLTLAATSAGTANTVLLTVTTNWTTKPNVVVLTPVDSTTETYGSGGAITVRSSDITSTGFSVYMTTAFYSRTLNWTWLAQ